VSVPQVVVVGAGVIGLSCAVVLSGRGFSVTVVTRDGVSETGSSVAAALWAPTLMERSERVRRWADLTLAELRVHATDADAGIREQSALTIGTGTWEPDPWMRSFAAPLRTADARELPEGYSAGVVSSIPLFDTSRYLPWLAARCRAGGVVFDEREVHAVRDAAPEGVPVVIAAGLGAGALVGDDSMRPVRGQVVRLSNPGLSRTVMVHDGSLAPLFIVPRFDDVVVGGPSQDGVWDPEPDAALEDAMLARAGRLVPALTDAEVLGRGVGHRPARPTVRVERETIDGTEVVHCYGHGGAGVALAWGCALDVADLVGAIR